MRRGPLPSMAGFYAMTLVAALIASTYCGLSPLAGWLLGVLYLTRQASKPTAPCRQPRPCKTCKQQRRTRDRNPRHSRRR